MNKIIFKIQPSERELKTLVYCKYLYIQGSTYLQNNNVNPAYFNISAILFSNSVELTIKALDDCITGKERQGKEYIKTIVKDLQKNPDFNLPYKDILGIFNARNHIYHEGTFLIYESCVQLKEQTLNVLSNIIPLMSDNKSFESLSIASLIKDKVIRQLIMESEQFLNEEKYEESIYKSTEAFGKFQIRLSNRSFTATEAFGHRIKDHKIDWRRIERKSLDRKDSNKDLLTFSHMAEEEINKKFTELIKDIDTIILLRNHYEDYKHFLRVCPIHHIMSDESILIDMENKKQITFNKENAEFIYSFVISVQLELEPQFRQIERKYYDGEVYKVVE